MKKEEIITINGNLCTDGDVTINPAKYHTVLHVRGDVTAYGNKRDQSSSLNDSKLDTIFIPSKEFPRNLKNVIAFSPNI